MKYKIVRRINLSKLLNKKIMIISIVLVVTSLLAICVVAYNRAANSPERQINTHQNTDLSKNQSQQESDTNTKASSNTGTGSASNTQNKNTASQTQSNCRNDPILYKTTYQNVTHLKKGQTTEAGGHNGRIFDCGDGKPIIAQPVDKIVYVGTGLTDEEIDQQEAAATREYDQQYSAWLNTRINAYQNCLRSMPSGYSSTESFCTSAAAQQAGQPPRKP